MTSAKDYISDRVFDGVRTPSPELVQHVKDNYARTHGDISPAAIANGAFHALTRATQPRWLAPIYDVDETPHHLEAVKQYEDSIARSAERLLANNLTPTQLRERADEYERDGLSPWLVDRQRELAATLELDARLEVLRCMIRETDDSITKMHLSILRDAIRKAHGLPTIAELTVPQYG